MTKRAWAVVIVLVLISAGFLAYRRITHDPYGPGTTHRVEMTFDNGPPPRCQNPNDMFLHGWRWHADGVVPESWGPASVPGTLHVDTSQTATFTSDTGVEVHMTGGKGRFSLLECLIR